MFLFIFRNNPIFH